MDAGTLIQLSRCGGMLLCAGVLVVMTVRRQWKDYWALGAFLAVVLVSIGSLWAVNSLAQHSAYRMSFYRPYFYLYWGFYAAESLLALVAIYSVFRNTLEPVRKLRRVGTAVFVVVAVVGELAAMWAVAVPAASGPRFLMLSISQMQWVQSVLTLFLLLAAWVMMRPMGLSMRSRVFGVGLGLGLIAAKDLLVSRRLGVGRPALALVGECVLWTAFLVWTAYFALPEPERGEVSPTWARWDQRLLS